MEQRTVKIKGVSPLLMHRFPMEPVEALEKRPIEEQAELSAYRWEDGQLYIPGINIQRALIGAAVYSKGKGRASLMKTAAACLMVDPEVVGLGMESYKIDTRPVVIPATKGRILRHRPRLDEWGAEFTLSWDEMLMTEQQARKVVDDAGTRVGLLDFRPEKKGPFGRFIVVGWE